MGCHRLVCAVALMLFAVGPAAPRPAAAAARQGGEIGLQAGLLLPDRDLTGEPTTLERLEPTLGIRGAFQFAPRWGWFVDSNLAVFESAAGDGITNYAARSGVELFGAPHWTDAQTFVALGGGWLGVARESRDDFNRLFGSIGVGQRFTVGPNQLLRWELRVDQTLTDDGADGAALTTGLLLVGFGWGMPSRAADSDGDGVPDRKDACPDTPRGARVDTQGCPQDGDGDGVADGIDQCPDTPAGWAVNGAGCPLDSDRDGVTDGEDDCPGTPPAVTVDDRGCPQDGDGDGVADGIDRCPDTPEFAHVDADGCPLDSDADGVYDGIDRCPQTAAGARVDPDGCPVAAPLFEERASLVLDGVFFEVNSAELTLNSKEILDDVAASLLASPEVPVEVGGFTDSSGNDGYNLALSHKRAEAVRAQLIAQGVAPERLTTRGYGEASPIADNTTTEGRARNRRVELRRLD
ncbi:MAG TPA: OmpA family protein [Candidatus Polarisedimenticolaceae bacterium]|nr:OmpA family protein [Candidatus Polarisedimenticolaceae bacterium]